MTFESKLQNRIQALNSNLCVGLDPRPPRIDGDVFNFLTDVIDQVEAVASAIKPNIAYFEAMGVKGYDILDRVIDYCPDDLPIILDVKRSDIPETQKYYAHAYFERWNVDAVTVNPYVGFDSIEPFLKYDGKAVYLLGVTSNQGARDLQLSENTGGAFKTVQSMCHRTSNSNQIGLVVGLTNLTQKIAETLEGIPLLIPGLGAQGGDVELIRRINTSASILVNSSRSILYGSDKVQGRSPGNRAFNYKEKIADALKE